MLNFYEWLSDFDLLARLRLLESYYTFNAKDYNQLFEDELEKLLQRVTDPAHRQILERMRTFDWLSYVAASVRNAGFRDQREVQEITHDLAVKLLMGKLFRGFDERISGPLDLRFKASVANAIRNVIEKERNRKRYLPTASTEYEPAARSSSVHDDEKVVEDFRQLVRNRLGDMAVSIFDLRMANGETKSLVGQGGLGVSRFTIKRLVREIKLLAREYASSLGNAAFLRDVQRAMERESATVQKRQAAAARKSGVGVG